MNTVKQYIIINQEGDIYCIADSQETANAIIEKDIASGDLESAIIQEAYLHTMKDV